MRILFDSRQTQYKTPFGTLRTGECCVLQIRIPTEVGTSGVRLMLEDSEHAVCAELPFSFVSRGEDGYELWRLEFTRQETGLHFYWFRIDKRGGDSFRLFGEYYYSPDSLSSGIDSYQEANAGARFTIMRPLSIEAGYRYLNLAGKDGNRDNAVADGPYVGVNASF